MSLDLTLDDVKRAAKREDFRAGVQMRLLTPRLSVRVTRFLLRTSDLSPNQVTLASFAVGLGAAAAFASPSPWLVLAGLAAYHVHVLLDYVDGEIARCRGLASTRGAYFDLMVERVISPLLVFGSAFGASHGLAEPTILLPGFAAAFGLLLDKEASDCWYRANAGADDIEDRYVAAPERTAWRRWRGRLALAAVMSRGLTAFLTYGAVATALDAAGFEAPLSAGGYRALVIWIFAPLMLAGAVARFLYVYRLGAIPRRQQLL